MSKNFHLIVSHNTRIQCLLNLIRFSDSEDKTRLKNCAIIRIEFSDITGISVKMIYPGELGDSEAIKEYKNPYYNVTPGDPEVFIPPSRKVKTKEELEKEEKGAQEKRGQEVEDSLFTKGQEVEKRGQEVEDSLFARRDSDIRETIYGSPPDLDELDDIRETTYGSPNLQELEKHRVGGMFGFPSNPSEPRVRKEARLNYVIPPEHCRETREDLNIKGNHVFYLVRHGQALHNKAKWFNATYDTSVTGNGMTQAYNAGKALVDIMLENNERPLDLFVSDLKRTVETMHQLIEGMWQRVLALEGTSQMPRDHELFRKIETELNHQDFIVLPCASEINMISSRGNCDQVNGESRSLKKLAVENQSVCTAAKTRIEHDSCAKKGMHRLNWLYYLKFYGGSVRSEPNPPMTNRQCRDTNMLANAIEYVNSTEWRLPKPPPPKFRIGGTRKKRKTRRRKRLTRK